MNGLEKITQRILSDSKSRCASIISDAEAQAREITEKSLEAAGLEARKIEELSKKEIKQISENTNSACESIRKRAVLGAKCDIINSWINKAKEHIESLEKDKYFEFVASVAVKHHSAGDGILFMRCEDVENLPEGFLDSINRKIEGDGGHFSEIRSADIGLGCVISYGDIEENCTVDALFDEKSDEIKDILFSFFK